MKTTDFFSRTFNRGLILYLLCLVATACVTPTAIPSPSASDTISKATGISPTDTQAYAGKNYQNTSYGFQLSYPEQGQLTEGTDGQLARIDLPIAPGTNLHEKYAQIDVQEDAGKCISPLAQGYDPGMLKTDQITVNGIDFNTTSGSEGAAGNYYDWIAYSTIRNGICISISFVLHSTNPFNYPTPPPEFDKPSETKVFMEIISTFKWME